MNLRALKRDLWLKNLMRKPNILSFSELLIKVLLITVNEVDKNALIIYGKTWKVYRGKLYLVLKPYFISMRRRRRGRRRKPTLS
jgi:hypothetical protein